MRAIIVCLGFWLFATSLEAQNQLLIFRNSAFMDAQVMVDRESQYGQQLKSGLAQLYFENKWLDSVAMEILEDSRRFFQNPFDGEIAYHNLMEENFQIAIEALNTSITSNTNLKKQIDPQQYAFLKTCRPDFPDSYDAFVTDQKIVMHFDKDVICMNSQILKEEIEEANYPLLRVCDPKFPNDFASFSQPEIIISDSVITCFEDKVAAFARRRGISPAVYDLLKKCIDDLPENHSDFVNNHTIVISDEDYLCFMIEAKWVEEDSGRECIMDPISQKFLDLNDDGSPDCEIPEEFSFEEGLSILEPLSDGLLEESGTGGRSKSIAPATTAVATKPLSMTSLLVDGTAQFLVERVQQELTLAFFDKLMERLNKYPELQHLFPSTYMVLKNQEYFRVPSMGEVWLGAFETDIKGFVPNFQKMVYTDPAYVKIKDDVAFQVLGVVYTIGDAVNKSRTFVDVIEELSPLAGNDNVVGHSISFLQILLSNLSENDGNDNLKLASAQSYRNLNQIQKQYFFGLIYQKEEVLLGQIAIGNTSLAELFEDNYQTISYQVSELLRLIESFETQIDLLKEAKNQPNSVKADIRSRRIDLVELGFETLNFGFSMSHFSDPEQYYSGELYRFLNQFSSDVRNVTIAIEEEKLGLAFLHTLHTVVPILESRVEKLITDMADSTNVALNKKVERLKKVTHFINFYGGFMVDMLDAQSPEQVKELLKKYAQPVGSYRIKRRSNFAIELNAFPGFYTGWEFNESGGGTSAVTGVTAPIGLSISKGGRGYSYSLFVPVIDIGAAFSYRWDSSNDTQGFPEDITWHQILSPGAHFVVGLKKMPVSIMAGAQYTPRLRGISDDMLNLEPQGAWRLGFSAVVDIPIAKFFQKNTSYTNKDK
ncbi:MAG: hypothetical protein AAF502_17725 [Bacteroidota bacterium]